jgi:dipeptidyl aminopeptidase/acylaminoacyl peptidase
MGHSAGAHIIMMLAFDPQYLEHVEVPISSIRSVIGLAGPYDFLPLREPHIQKIFSTAKPLESSQPINFASATAPPVLLAMGLKDKRVDPQNSLRMAAAIEAKGGRVQLISYPDIGHSKILLSLSRPLRASSSVYHDTLAFIQSIKLAQP